MQAVDQIPFDGGVYEIEVIRDGPNGPQVLERRTVHNLVTTDGKTQTWRMCSGLSSNTWDEMRVGTCGAAAAVGNTNVISPVASTLTTVDSATMSGVTLVIVNSYASGVGSISATDIQEVCILNSGTSPGGSCLNRSTFTAVTKTEDDKLKITYKVAFT